MKFKNGDKVFDKKFKEKFIFDERTDGFVVTEEPDRFEPAVEVHSG